MTAMFVLDPVDPITNRTVVTSCFDPPGEMSIAVGYRVLGTFCLAPLHVYTHTHRTCHNVDAAMDSTLVVWQVTEEASRQRERADDPDPPAKDIAADRGAAKGMSRRCLAAWPLGDCSICFGRHNRHPGVSRPPVMPLTGPGRHKEVCSCPPVACWHLHLLYIHPSPALPYPYVQAKAAADLYHQGHTAPVKTAEASTQKLLDQHHDGPRPHSDIHPATAKVSMGSAGTMGLGRRDPPNDPLMAAILENAAARLRDAQTAAARKGSKKQAMAGPGMASVLKAPQAASCSRHVDCGEQHFCTRERTCMPSGQCSPRPSPVKTAPTGRPIE